MAGFASLAIAVVLCVSPAAFAAGSTERALHDLDRGIDAFRAGHYEDAKAAFERARRLEPTRANAYRWLGFTEVKLGDCTQALIDFETFLRAVPATDERVTEVIRQRSECQAPERPATPAPAAAVTPATTSIAPSAPRAHESIARKWWLWTLVGVVAAGAATGIALGVVYSRPHETALPGLVCDASGCRMAP